MASYQARQRERLFDDQTQAVIARRGRELIGLMLMGLGAILTLLLVSYVPDDPSWLSATDEPASNILGRFGASIAVVLHIMVGYAAWGLPLTAFGWGLRFVSHRGAGRALNRIIFLPIAIAVAAVYASTLVPGAAWTHSFGLGGLFGDTVLGAVLGVAPGDPALGLKILSAVFGVLSLVLGLSVLGFTWFELRRAGWFLAGGVVLAYGGVMTLLGRGAVSAVRKAGNVAESRLQARQLGRDVPDHMERAEPQLVQRASVPRAPRDDPAKAPAALAQVPRAPAPPGAEAKGPLRLRLPSLMKREAPEPVVEPEDEVLDGDDRIRAKIADVVKSRVRHAHGRARLHGEPPLTARRRGPEPMILKNVVRVPPAPFVEAGEIDEAEDFESGVPMEPPLSMPEPELVQAPPRPAAPIPREEPRRVVQHTPRKTLQPSRAAQAESQPSLRFDESLAEYETPPLSLLMDPAGIERHHLSDDALEENARMLENVLDDYGVKGEIVTVRPGPVVTMYELEPAPGLKASRVIGLADDIARSMSALSARVSTVPGRSVIGIELPNEDREKVVLREMLASRDFGDSNMRLPLALGKNIGGDPVIANLAKMPHLLIAGTTGSGKSVAINTMILSLLYKLTPDECRLIMIDPKMLELSVYDGIPHLLSPVVTDPKKAVVALKWVVGEMEDRYRKMSKMGVRNIEGYNGRVREALDKGELFKRTVQTGFDDETGEPVFETEEFAPELLPYIVVIVDEMADLMMVAGKEIEACIQRLAQMARASGIHLIMATQRPSVDVITGTIKANFPTRISFQVTSKIDSRTILGEQGAEQLLGMGDMLYMAGGARITRVHGPFVSDEEVEEIVSYLKSFGPPAYVGGVVEGPDEDAESDIDLVLGLGGNTDSEDALYDQAVQIVIKDRKCSTSYIQRKLAIGYNKAARLVEQMETEGLVSPANHVGKREILVPEQN
ncbi:MAG: DNA translocase FtsK 4TM domain-containing protein [Paracoccaceae bacterium]